MTKTTPKHRLEEDVSLSDGTVVRVTGLWAVEFRKNPDAVRKDVEEVYRRTRGTPVTSPHHVIPESQM